jgi:CBS domain-containing protein
MSVAHLLRKDFPTVLDTDTLATAISRLVAAGRRVVNVPVVDAEGRLVGSLSEDDLLAAILPRSATIEDGLTDLGFVSDTLEQLCDKLAEIADDPVADYMEHPCQPLYTNSSLSETMLRLYHGENDLPVVEPGGDKLVGVVSAYDVLYALAQKPA